LKDGIEAGDLAVLSPERLRHYQRRASIQMGYGKRDNPEEQTKKGKRKAKQSVARNLLDHLHQFTELGHPASRAEDAIEESVDVVSDVKARPIEGGAGAHLDFGKTRGIGVAEPLHHVTREPDDPIGEENVDPRIRRDDAASGRCYDASLPIWRRVRGSACRRPEELCESPNA
jgi:hypothetical protein